MRTEADLHDYQQRAITRLYESDRCQAVVPMGGGKTIITLSAIAELIADGEIRGALVLAPKRVSLQVWPKEYKEWAHTADMHIVALSGGPFERAGKLTRPADVYVCGVDNTQWLVAHLLTLDDDDPIFDLLVIDELSRFKGPRSKRARALFKVVPRFKAVWGLTGTPRPNGYIDQFNPLKLLSGGKLWGKSYDTWLKQYFMSTDWNGYNWVIRSEWEDKIRNDAASLTFTVDPAEVPAVHAESLKLWVDLPIKARKAYDQMEKKLFADTGGEKVIAASQGVAAGKLEQIAQGFLYDDGVVAETYHTEKRDALVDLADGAAGGEQLLIAYHFKEDLAVLRELWPDLAWLGQGVSDKKAAEHESAWNAGELDRLALHPASAGHGLNLQFGGNHLVFYSLPWSAELYDQVIKRIARQGQSAKQAFVHHIMARNTIDEVKYARVHDKMSMQDAFTAYLERI